ncbi:peptidase S8/S53 domain-containing protein [Nemania sp. FL0916]|nr:peptidase S8/S53 domain-containing protein [Nemania sp. FL0916]
MRRRSPPTTQKPLPRYEAFMLPCPFANHVKAIKWAVKQNAHIISLSLGFKSDIPEIKAAIKEAIDQSRTIIVAAAGNWGYNYPPPFPASQRGVLRVHAVDGNGKDAQVNVKVDSNNRFATLGLGIESEWQGKKVWLTGTSFATPIFSAIVANILQFAQQELGLNHFKWKTLSSFQGIQSALTYMCTDAEKFAYLAPWSRGMSKNEVADAIQESLVYGLLVIPRPRTDSLY